MKFIPMIWANLWRRPVRTAFTLLSTAIAFLLFGSLHGITTGVTELVSQLSADRLRVQSKASMMDALPIAYLEQIRRVPGVTNVTSIAVFPAYLRDARQSIPAAALGGENPIAALPPQVRLGAEEGKALLRTRTGAIVGLKLAQEYGWKVGDRVTLTSNLWMNRNTGPAWSFDIVALYDWEGHSELARELYFNYDYLNEARTQGRDTANMYAVQVDTPAKAAGIAEAIDRLFVNSSHPTFTQNDREWLQAQLKQIGDVKFLVNGIVAASLFALLFVISNVMMQSVRERTGELAVLKTLGFIDRWVLALVVSEAIVLCLPGAAAGLLLAWATFPSLSSTLRSPISMSGEVLIVGGLLALSAALFSAFVPGWRAMRLPIVDALARR